jgi:hypothetical protein
MNNFLLNADFGMQFRLWLISFWSFYFCFFLANLNHGYAQELSEPFFIYEDGGIVQMNSPIKNNHLFQNGKVVVAAHNPEKLKSFYQQHSLPFQMIPNKPNVLEIPLAPYQNLNTQSKNSIPWAHSLKSFASYLRKTPSFLIDQDQIVFTEIKRQFNKQYGKKINPELLVEYSFNLLTEKIGLGGFAPSSYVLKRRSGNSSDHSTLLCALLRLYQFDCVIISGVVIKMDGAALRYLNRSWILTKYQQALMMIDPLMPLDRLLNRFPLFYLPHFILTDESIDFRKSLNWLQDQEISSMEFIE